MAILEESSGLSYDDGLAYVCHPEFLREGTAIEDFEEPRRSYLAFGDTARKYCEALYPGIEAPTFYVDVSVAAMVKYADNCSTR